MGTLSAAPDVFDDLELSPDGRRALVSIFDSDTGTRDCGSWTPNREARTRLTTAPEDEGPGVWAPDGERVVYPTTRKDRAQSSRDLLMISVAGGGETVLAREEGFPARQLVGRRAVQSSIQTCSPGSPGSSGRRRAPSHHVTAREAEAGERTLSPDSRWIAFSSNDSGRPEVYVSAFPKPQGRRQVSAAGGAFPRWRRDGHELFFLFPQNQLMSSAVTIAAGGSRSDSAAPVHDSTSRSRCGYPYDVTADGQRFLVNVSDEPVEPTTVTLLTNWPALLRK